MPPGSTDRFLTAPIRAAGAPRDTYTRYPVRSLPGAYMSYGPLRTLGPLGPSGPSVLSVLLVQLTNIILV